MVHVRALGETVPAGAERGKKRDSPCWLVIFSHGRAINTALYRNWLPSVPFTRNTFFRWLFIIIIMFIIIVLRGLFERT